MNFSFFKQFQDNKYKNDERDEGEPFCEDLGFNDENGDYKQYYNNE